MLKILVQIFAVVVTLPFRIIGYFFPKDDALWVFGAWLGKKYADNPKQLFEYVTKHAPEIKAVWLTKDTGVYERLQKQGKPVCMFYSWRGIWYALRAKYVVFCVAYQDVSIFAYLFSHNAVLVNLWHGTPLKRLIIKRNLSQKIIRTVLTSLIGREYDYVCSSSDDVTEKLDNYFRLPKHKYLLTGYPRNDAIFKDDNEDIADLLAQIGDKKIVLYMPTFREYLKQGRRVDLFRDFGFNAARLNEILEEHNAVFLIKLHFRDMPLFNSVNSLASSNIVLLRDEQIAGDIYPLLAKTDILVTDYSSVFFDYLLADRPMIFTNFDIDHYVKDDRGFYYDYDSVTPGPKARNWQEFGTALEETLSREDKYAHLRQEVSQLVNRFADGESSKRVYEAIADL